ncbi:MAG TPA: molecular chaperone TorD family protein [Candidatus Binatia bacterium]|nr:molecular chaperone TorD family protein [Candidatus Binatia bacterium]
MSSTRPDGRRPADARGSARVADGIRLAAEWRLLGLLLERPRLEWQAEIERLAAEVADPPLRAAVAAARTASEGEYHALLGPGGPAPAREASVLGMGDPGWMMADLSRTYDAFGYAPRAEDPKDHVAVEVGFVGFLLLKEALAWASDDEVAARTVIAARTAFVADHLRALVLALAERLAVAPESHVALAVDVLAARVAAIGDGGATAEAAKPAATSASS